MGRKWVLSVGVLSVLVAPTAWAEERIAIDADATLTALRHAGWTLTEPRPLCGASTDTGVAWGATMISIGSSLWQLRVTGSYTTIGGTIVSFEEVQNATLYDGQLFGSLSQEICGTWQSCQVTATLYWWNGLDWELSSPQILASSSANCR